MPTLPNPTKSSWPYIAATVLWAAVLVLGAFGLNSYSLTAGPRGDAPPAWPAELGALETELAMVVYAHPHCPCTRATLWEAAELVAAAQGRLSVQVHFFVPQDKPDDWALGDLWNIAQDTPHTTAFVDREGRLAASHGAQTSGHVRVYGANNLLAFDGGLTASRGHQGLSVGKDAIKALLAKRTPRSTATPVYGCGISAAQCTPPKS